MSKLKIVTISGADDNTDISKMSEISARFPFVEWGILMSPNNYGKPRYPSKTWIENIIKKPNLQKSLHLCGNYARLFSTAKVVSMPDMSIPGIIEFIKNFDRVQVNMAKELSTVDIDHFAENINECYNIFNPISEILLQIPLGSSPIMEKINDKLYYQTLFPFLDISGGAGLPGEWKLDFEWSGLRGFAGGIKPDNVEQIIENIKPNLGTHDTFWIDMESGIRTNDVLDLNLVENVLSVCEKHIILKLA